MISAVLRRHFGADRVVQVAGAVDACLEKYAWRWLAVFVAILLAASIAKSIRSKLWIDELYTYYIAQQPTVSSSISAVREGCDGAPPLYAIIVRWLQPVLGAGSLALRLPSTVGFAVMCWCVFVFVFRRFSALYAAIAMMFTCVPLLYYASEGRSYGLVMGCAAFSLVAWQAASDGRHRKPALVALALSLGLATALHYYAVFLLVPVAVGEAVRWRTSLRFDWPVLSALCLSPLVLALHLPLMRVAEVFMPFFWSKASFHLAKDFYYAYCLPSPVLFVAVVLPFVIWKFPLRPELSSRDRTETGMPAHEWTACFVMALMPAIIVVVSLYTTKVFVFRYVLWMAIGFWILATAAIHRLTRGSLIVGTTILAFLLVTLGMRMLHMVTDPVRLPRSQSAMNQIVDAPTEPERILIADAHVFMELAFYAEPSLRKRLVHPLSPALERLYTNVDTDPLLLSSLRHRVPLQLPDYEEFLEENHRFLLVANTDDWIVWHLMASGYDVTPLRKGWPPGIFDVRAPSALELGKALLSRQPVFQAYELSGATTQP